MYILSVLETLKVKTTLGTLCTGPPLGVFQDGWHNLGNMEEVGIFFRSLIWALKDQTQHF